MLKSLYKTLPKSIKTRLWLTISEQVKAEDERREKETWDRLPKCELEEENIRHLKVLKNRDAFLEHLPTHSVVTEIGVAKGDFSESILRITQPKELHLIDSWIHDDQYLDMRADVEKRFQREIDLGQIHIHQGYSTSELERFKDGYLDWVYIDASHDYDSTVDELEICRQKLKKGGIIAGHDYVTGAWVTRVRFGVVEAVNEFCIKHNWEMIYLTNESHRHLSFAIREIQPQING